MALVDEVMTRLLAAYPAASDPERAAGMTAYLRGRFPFLGIPMTPRRVLSRQVLAGLPRPTGEDLCRVALACWERPEREYQYFAVDWLCRYPKLLAPDALPVLRRLVTTKSWWDTVDALASHAVGGLVAAYPEQAATMDDWAAEENLWLVRTAILHQLRRGATTDTGRLFGYCAAQAGHPDFFVRKAIGWALRQHARVDPDGVRAFVAAHPELSPLSVREALKHLGPLVTPVER